MAEATDIETKIRRLRKDFQKNIVPVLKRNDHFVSKGQRRRLKKLKAIRRWRKLMS